MTRNKTDLEGQTKHGDAGQDVPTGSKHDDLVDVGSEYSFPASDPPSYMGGIAITGAPPHHGEAPREGVSRTLVDPDEAKPA